MPFQLNAKNLFLTYPQCPLSKEWVADELIRLLDPVVYVVAHELHKNGDDHLHVYLELRDSLRTRDPNYFDLHHELGHYHGNYQGCRSSKNVLKYCTKAEDFLSNIDVGALVNKKSTKGSIAKQLLIDKRPLEEVAFNNPELLFGYSKLKIDLITLKEDLGIEEDRPDLPPDLPNPWGLVLPSFSKSKRRHYWIYSREPDVGKTYHFGSPLLREYRGYSATGDLTYWEVTPKTQFIIFDDFNTARLKADHLNQLCDGTYQFRRIYRGNVQIDQYVVIVLSNCTPEELYPNFSKYLLARFNVYNVDKKVEVSDFNLYGSFLV